MNQDHRSNALADMGSPNAFHSVLEIKMESRQKAIFEGIHADYYASTADRYARRYKDRYVYAAVRRFVGKSRKIIELACGQGEASGLLLRQDPQIDISGCDISEAAAADYRAIHGRPCVVADLTKPFDHEDRYEAAVVMGGIHHLVGNLDIAFWNIANLLAPGGRLIMAEPNADYFLNPIRRLWYKLDKTNFDSQTEEALSHDCLLRDHGNGFRPVGLNYFGGPAYFMLTMNMFMRIPNASKRLTAPLLMGAERLYDLLPGRLPFAAFVACWERI